MKTPSSTDLSWGLLALQSGLVTLHDFEAALQSSPENWIHWLESSGRISRQQRQKLDKLWDAYVECQEQRATATDPVTEGTQQEFCSSETVVAQPTLAEDDDASVEASFLTLVDSKLSMIDPSDDADISTAATMNQSVVPPMTSVDATVVTSQPCQTQLLTGRDDSADIGTIQEGSRDSISLRSRPVDEPLLIKNRFAVLQFHAEGGMARVSIAMDSNLNRRVAFKEMKSERPRSERAGFEREAQITGNLEHPNIVPIYDMGKFPDGRPFYAMRFIQGESFATRILRFHVQRRSGGGDVRQQLKTRADWAHHSGFRELLASFQTVCQAIAFAHSKRYLHRDLKPDNIMLGSYGETFVVDWGLARRMGAGHETHSGAGAAVGDESVDSESIEVGSKTMKGIVKGTLKYMSPEQAAGKHDELGPESDIYSLGVILFEILVGQPALGALADGVAERKLKMTELLRRIKAGEFKKPSELVAHIPLGLEAICLKAMQIDPQQRYHDAVVMAADIAAWLTDDPITVVPETKTTHAVRWLRRHQAVVGTGLAGAFGLAAVLSGFLFLISCKNHDLTKAERAASIARDEAVRNADEAQTQKKAAVTAQTLAEFEQKNAVASASKALESAKIADQRRRDAEAANALAQESLKAMQSLVAQIQHQPSDSRESLKLKTALLRTAFKGLKDVSDQVGQNTAQNRDAALAHRELGHLFMQMDVDGEHGGVAAALVEFDKSREILTTLRKGHPEATDLTRDLAITLELLGESHLRMGQTEEAIRECLEPSIELRKSIVPIEPMAAEQHDREVSACEARLGQAQLILGLAEEALRRLAAAIESRRQHNQQRPETVTEVSQREFADWYASLGDANFSLGMKSEAIAAYESGLNLLDEFVAMQPQSMVAQQGLAAIYRRLSTHMSESGDETQADRLNRLALAATGSNGAVSVAALEGSGAAAKSLFGGPLARRVVRQRVAIETVPPAFQPEADPSSAATARSLPDDGPSLEELDSTEADLEQRRRAILAKGASRDSLLGLAAAYSTLGKLMNQAKRYESAHRVGEQGIAVLRTAVARDPIDATMQFELARSLVQQTDTLILLEKEDAAARVLQQSQSLLQTLAKRDSSNQRLSYELVTLERRLGQIERLNGQYPLAAARYADTATKLKQFIGRKQSVAAAQQELKLVENAAKYARLCEVALSNWEQLLAQPPEQLPYLLSVRCTELRRGNDTAPIVQAAAKLAELEPHNALNHMCSACGYGICLKVLDRQKPHSEVQLKQRAELVERAMEQLKLALKSGANLDDIKEDADLAALRDHDAFVKLLAVPPMEAAP